MEATPANLVPCLPETAPFSPEQRAYLNGFFAGLFSRQADPGSGPGTPPSQPPLMTLSILYGSQTGTAETLSKRLAKEAGKRGFAPTVHSLAKYPISQLASETRVLIVTSTFGDGEPPDNAKAFWEQLQNASAPKLPDLKFSVCALGDSNYPKFCRFGVDLDARLAALGAQRIHARVDCDVDYDQPFAQWMNTSLPALAGSSSGNGAPIVVEPTLTSETKETTFDRNNPFAAILKVNRKLTGNGSEKDVRHFEISVDGSGLRYEAGDALGVYPSNCPALADELISLQNYSGDELVPSRDGVQLPLREALLHHYEITKIPLSLLKAVASRHANEELTQLVSPSANGHLSQFLWGREIVDLLLQFPMTGLAPAEFVGLLRKIAPRLYSISSSPKATPDHVHLTINVLRYQSLGRSRKGVCSTYLAERRAATEPVPVYVHHNPNFRPPATADAPMIMVGPGTGIAPFRAFLQERRATGAKGKNWLFFGDQRAATDFLYQEELKELQKEGVLTHLDTCFSRDQAEKVYVQHRMKERAKELYGWLEEGAHFYVCGDANRMAKDVDTMLHEVVSIGSGRNQEQAAEYIGTLKAQNRYVRDVY